MKRCLVFLFMFASVCLVSCNNSHTSTPAAMKIAQETIKNEPVVVKTAEVAICRKEH